MRGWEGQGFKHFYKIKILQAFKANKKLGINTEAYVIRNLISLSTKSLHKLRKKINCKRKCHKDKNRNSKEKKYK